MVTKEEVEVEEENTTQDCEVQAEACRGRGKLSKRKKTTRLFHHDQCVSLHVNTNTIKASII